MHCGVPGSVAGDGVTPAASGLCPVLRAFHRWTGGHAGGDLAGFTPREFGKGGCRIVSAPFFSRNLGPARRWAMCLIAGVLLLAGCKKAPSTQPAAAVPSRAEQRAALPADSTPAAVTPVESS